MKLLTSTLILAFLVTSCTSTFITSSWKAPNTAPVKFKKMVVIGLVGEYEQRARQLMEKHFVDDLKSLGYDAVCSCEEYTPDFFKGLTEKEAIAKLRGAGVDGIITIVLLDKKNVKTYVPARAVNIPVFWDYYRTVYNQVYTKGYYTDDTKYFWESNLYDLTANQLLYSVQSQSFDPASTETLAHEYGKLIVKKMTKHNMLVKHEPIVLKSM